MTIEKQLIERIGRRVKLRDLHVLMTVQQAGSMGKAALQLNTTQSAVSRSIADLEHAVGVRLLDRSRQGIELTKYGQAVVDCGVAVFDDLRQGVKNIEFLTDPTAGEVGVGGNEVIVAGLLPAVFNRLRNRYPKIAVGAVSMVTVRQQHEGLRARKVDLAIGRVAQSPEPDIDTEILFYDRIAVVAGSHSKWARRRKIELSELADEPWSLPPPDSLVGSLAADAFRAAGVEFPRRGVATGTIILHCALLASGPFLGLFPTAMLRFCPSLPPLKVLPVDLGIRPWPIGIMTLKHRTLSPAAQLFIDHTRRVVRPLAKGSL
jgi:DNA-binding transcriptional LysR family regulator